MSTLTDRERRMILRGTLGALGAQSPRSSPQAVVLPAEPVGGFRDDGDIEAWHAAYRLAIDALPVWRSIYRADLARALREALPIRAFCDELKRRDDPDDMLAVVLRRRADKSVFALRIEHFFETRTLVVAEFLPIGSTLESRVGRDSADNDDEGDDSHFGLGISNNAGIFQ